MKYKLGFAIVTGLLSGALFSAAAVAEDELPQITEEGLHLLQDRDLAVVYAKPGVDLGVYNRVLLVEAGVAFKKNWQRDQNRSRLKVSSSDMDKIKNGVAELFYQVFAEKLSEAGYELTEDLDEDVLIVRPAIVNLDVTAPDTMSATRSYQVASSAGEMTLYLELYDAFTNDLLGKAMDRKKDRDSGFYTWQSKVSNRQAARRIMQNWADVLVNALDEAHKAAGGSE